MSLELCLKQLHVEHIKVFHRMQYIRLLLFYSVIFRSVIFQSCKFQSPRQTPTSSKYYLLATRQSTSHSSDISRWPSDAEPTAPAIYTYNCSRPRMTRNTRGQSVCKRHVVHWKGQRTISPSYAQTKMQQLTHRARNRKVAGANAGPA